MIVSPDQSIYLASRSPRRRDLLNQIGIRFSQLFLRMQPESDPDTNEDPRGGERPEAYVERLARAKALAGWNRIRQRQLPRAPVLAADTTVALENRIFGKPADRREAAQMLGALGGRWHDVYTAIVLRYDERIESALSRTLVQFRALDDDEIARYIATGEADDKAGAYGIQGRAAQFVIEIRGSYSGVMGLPLYETAELLQRMAAGHERRQR